MDADELAEGGSAPIMLLLLPGLVGFAAAIGAARLLPVVGRLLARRGTPSVRLAGVSLARAPGAAGIAAAFLALAIGLAALAESYRSTLARGERDRAAFALPTDIVVRENLRALVPVLRAAPLERYETLPGVEAAHPIVRATASAGPASSISGVTVLGASADAVESLPLWRDDWGLSQTALADAIAADGPAGLRGPLLRGSTLRLAVDPGLVSYVATIEQRDGVFRTLDLGTPARRRPGVLSARLPAAARGGRLVAITLRPPRLSDRGADSGVALRGRTTLRVLGLALDDWVGQGGVTIGRSAVPGELDLAYTVTNQREARIRPRQVTDDEPPAAVVTTRLGELAGGVGGILPLRVGGGADRDRGRGGRRTAAGSLRGRGRRRPGDAPDRSLERRTRRCACRSSGSTSRRARGRASRRRWLADPSRCSRRARGRERGGRPARPARSRHAPRARRGSARRAHARGVGLALAVRADLRDDRGELYDLEAQGATPALLRRSSARAALRRARGLAGGHARRAACSPSS